MRKFGSATGYQTALDARGTGWGNDCAAEMPYEHVARRHLVPRACSALPTSGPASWDVRSSQPKVPDTIPYAFVKLDAKMSTILTQFTPRLSNAFANRSPPKEFRFGIGDIVSVTIFEAAAGGLFIPAEAGVRPGNFVTIPNQSVDANGNVSCRMLVLLGR